MQRRRPALRSVPAIRRAALWLVLGGVGLAPHGALAATSLPLKVRGAATLSATARAGPEALEVRGLVMDDAGRPLGGAHLRLRITNAAGAPMSLPEAESCPPTTRVELSSSSLANPDRYLLEADGRGEFCVRVPGEFEAGKVWVSFEDPRDLFESASRQIPIDTTRRALVLEFAPQPDRLDLAQPTHTLVVDTKLKPPLVQNPDTEAIRLDLLLGVADARPVRLASSTLQAGARGQFDVASNQLGAPGKANLIVRFAGSETLQPAEHSVAVSRTAQVTLTMAEPEESAVWGSGTAVPVAVGHVGGAVPGGSVEARIMGRTVGIAPVKDGAAAVQVRVESSRRQQVTVTLHYLPDAPWWIPGPPLEAQVMTVSPAGWVRWTWIALAGLVAGWTFLAWRRPRRRPAKNAMGGAALDGTPRIEVVRRVAPNSGWSGRVLDAHDGTPIAQAELCILGPAFHGSGVLQATAASTEGRFSLMALPPPWPEGVLLRVTARMHATLEQPLPVEGEIAIHLTTRRRALLQRFSLWVERRGQPYHASPEPTPGRVAALGNAEREPGVAEWARDIERAAYGPTPPDAEVERGLIEREPGT